MLKTYIKKFTAIAILFLSSGCATFKTPNFSMEEFIESKKGIIFISATENKCSLPFLIKNAKSGLLYIVHGNKDFFEQGLPPSYTSKNMLILDPGIYYIEYMQLLTIISGYSAQNSTTRYLPSPGLDINGIVKYGAFEVKSGQVNYIENLVYSSDLLSLEDNYESLKTQLSNDPQRSILIDKVKPGTFYHSGSIIYTNKNGEVKIIDSKKVQELREKVLKKNPELYKKLENI